MHEHWWRKGIESMTWACNVAHLISTEKLQGELGGAVLAPAAWAHFSSELAGGGTNC